VFPKKIYDIEYNKNLKSTECILKDENAPLMSYFSVNSILPEVKEKAYRISLFVRV
jgi:hypothetical protein